MIEYRVRRIKKDRPFFAMRQYFRGFDPIAQKSITIRSDDETGMTTVSEIPNEDTSSTGADGGTVTHSWKLTDQPAVKQERSLPPWWSFTPFVFVSTGDWQAYAAEVQQALVAAATGQAQAESRAAELVGNLVEENEKLVTLRDFVARNIRAAGPGIHALPLKEITPADRTLAEGYGNGADRAVLLYAMLKAATLEPEFVLASRERRVQNLDNPLLTCPHPGKFPALLVRVKTGDGFIYLNDTNQYDELGVTSHDGYLGLVLSTGKIETIHAAKAMRNRTEIEFSIQLSETGDAAIAKTKRFYGNAFGAFHRKFAEMPPEERSRYHQEAVAGISLAAEADGDLVTRYDTYPGIENLSVKVEKFAVRDDEYLYLRLPYTLANLLGLRSDTRDNPYYWSAPRRLTVRTHIRMPDGFSRPSLKPPAIDWRAPGNSGRITVTCAAGSENSLIVSHFVDLPPAVIDAADYDKLLDINRRLSHSEAGTILLRRN